MKTYCTILLVRHGETEWNLCDRFQGQMDSPLSPRGLSQAKALEEHFSVANAHPIPCDAIYSSDLGRAMDTAKSIAKAKGLMVQPDARLRERKFGIFEGLTRTEAQAKHPDSFNLWTQGSFTHAVSGGESRQELCTRVLQGISDIVKTSEGKTLALVTHGGVLASLWRYLDPTREETSGFRIPNASITTARILNPNVQDPKSWDISSWSNTEHLKSCDSLDDPHA